MQFDNEHIANDEILYRRVPTGFNFYSYSDGKLKVSSQAFGDRNKEISVDRAKLCNHDPCYSQNKPTDGVLSLVAEEIREIKFTINTPPLPIEYAIDIKADPLKHNHAHALIISSPEYKSNRAFEKVKEKLAYIANMRGWEWPSKEG